MAIVVDEDRLVVPARVSGPVVVSFDGQYVWSFSPSRDGSRTPGGWKVTWPEVLQPRLEGTTRVTLGDAVGGAVHFDEVVAFRGSSEPLEFRDQHGHPLAVDKMGHLTRVFSETDDEVKRVVVEGAAKALTDLREKLGVDAHLSYGCLLGAVRDGKMIGHDSDADLAYYSPWTTPADIIRESYRMERGLRELGWRVVRMSGADLKLFHPLGDGRVVHIDIFGAFHVNGVFYQLGGRSGHLPREALTPAGTIELEGVTMAAPADPERVLAFLYGESWRVPDPAFENVDPPEGIRRLDGWLRGFRTHVIPWNELLRDRRSEVPRRRSTFAEVVQERVPAGTTIVEIGSGNGRDAQWFAKQDRRVIAFDFAGAAVRQTRRRVGQQTEKADVRVLHLNDFRAVALAGAELSREPEPPHVYARGLVGGLDLEARTHLWRLCSMTLRRGGALHLESVATGPGLPEWELPGLMRRVDVDALVAEIEAAGGHVVRREVGPGTDFWDQPDSHVARLEVTWTRTTPTPREQA